MDEGDTCRICRTGEEDDTPLYHPCKCSGSIAKVHQDCLIEWLQHSKKKSCELCNTELRFHKVYSPSMPVKLPAYLYLRRMILKFFIALRFSLRAVFVGTAWLALLPLGNLYIWRLHFWIVDAILWGLMGGEPPSSRSLNATTSAVEASNHTSGLVETLVAVTNSTLTSVSEKTKVESHPTQISGIPFPFLPLEKLVMRIINHAGYRHFFDTLAHDTFEGQILTCAVVVLFVSLFLLREWCLQNMPQQVEGLAPQPAQQAQPALIGAAGGNADIPRNPVPLPLLQVDPELQQPNRRPVVMRNPFEQRDNQRREQRDDLNQIDGNDDADRDSDVSENNIVFQEGEDEDSANDDAFIENRGPEENAEGNGVAPHVRINNAGLLNFVDDDDEDAEDVDIEDDVEDIVEEREAPPFARFGDAFGEIVAGNEPPAVREPARQPPLNGNDQNENIVPNFDANDWDDGDGDNLDNGERLEDDLEGMMEAIGMQGPLINLVTNMTMMFVLCSFILTVFVAFPYSIGRLLGVGQNLVKVISLPIKLLRIGTDPIVDRLVELIRRVFLFVWKSDGMQASSSTFSVPQSGASWKFWGTLSNKASETTMAATSQEALRTTILSLINNLGSIIRHSIEGLQEYFKELEAMTNGQTTTDRALCIGLGHFYWLVGLGIQHKLSRLYIRWNLKTLNAFVDQQIVVLKVLGFIVLELMVFPLCCGILTDVSLHPLWKDVSISSRIALVQSKPLSICFTLWSLGTLYMFALAQFVSNTRSIVRPGVLCFVRDAGDPNFHPIRDILERRSLEQLRKIGISGIIYSSILAITLGLCSRMLAWTTSGIVPLNWNVHQTFSSIGFEMIGVAILLPIAVKAWFPSHWVKRAAKKWWRSTAQALCISSYLIGGRYPKEEVPSNPWNSIKVWIVDQMRMVGIVPEVEEDKNEAKDETKNESIPWGGFARVPADDHAIMTSPLVIRTDSSGQPIDARGKEAMKAQMEAIEKIKKKKPQYTIVHLPDNFRARIITLFVALWLTLCAILLTILLPPLIVGRSTIQIIKWNFQLHQHEQGAVHDGLAWSLGCCVFGISHTIGSKVQRMYLKMRTSSNAPRRFGKHVRRFLQRCALVISFGLITSTTLGLVIEVYLNGMARVFSGNPILPDISLFHVWSMGLMEQYLIFEIIRIRLGRTFRPNWDNRRMRTIAGRVLGPMYALLELQNGGWRKPKMMVMVKGAFLPAIGYHFLALIVPLCLNYFIHLKLPYPVEKIKSDKVEAAETSLIFAICSIFVIFGLLYQKIIDRMNSWTNILKDEHFLISTELKNYSSYQSDAEQDGQDGHVGQTNPDQQVNPNQRQNQNPRLNAEGPIPDALLNAN